MNNTVICTKVSHDPYTDLFTLHFAHSAFYSVPAKNIQGLVGLIHEEILDCKIINGHYISWPKLDLDLTVDGILSGIYGTTKWMAQLNA